MSGFTKGYTLAQMQQALAPVAFTPPAYASFPDKMLSPKFLQWNFEIQHQFGGRNIVTVGYVGNKGYDIFLRNVKVNANYTASRYPNGFGGIPAVSPDPRFRQITDWTNGSYSNYNGLTASYRRIMGYGFSGTFGYTWSHALDTVSNGGTTEIYSGDSLTNQLDPYNLKGLNYSNADYDIRHNFVADFLWEPPVKIANKFAQSVLGGWSLGTKIYARTGTPFSVFNSSMPARISPATGGTVLATLLDPAINTHCTNVDQACFTARQFASTTAQASFGNLPRNSFRGPNYVDFDTTLMKRIQIREGMAFTVGASAYNVFNHPNFGSPGQNVAVGGLGIISSTVGPPTSAYGSFQGSAVNGRVLVLSGRFQF
jgi:hypothetical protein